MNLEPRLRAFAAVARTGSFSRAGEALLLSQPAVSKHIAALEAELGQALFARKGRGVSMTSSGEMLADFVLRAEALLVNGKRAIARGVSLDTGTLALAGSGIPGTYILPGLVATFHRLHPGIEIQFEVSTSGGALELVRSHASELAVIGGMVMPPELEGEPLIEDEVVLIGPPTLAKRRLRIRDLEQQTWISREEGSSTRAVVEAARLQLGFHPVRSLELPSWEAVKLAVAAGEGIAACSMLALTLELKVRSVAVLDIPRWHLARTLSVVRARDVPLTPPAQAFLELLRRSIRPQAEGASQSRHPAAEGADRNQPAAC